MDRPMPVCSVEKRLEKLRASIVIREMESQMNTLSICKWGMSAFISITGAAMKAKNPDAMADFLDDGGCEALLGVLSLHGENAEIAAHGCLVVCILAWSLREMREFLGEIGACEMIVYIASLHIGEPAVSEYASGAIGLLTKGNQSNSFRIAEANGCDIIAQIGNFGFNVRQERCIKVATNVCYAISPLCEAVNSSRLIECGACALVIELSKLHMKNEEFAIAAVKALCSLASLNLILREELGKVGACEYLMDIIPLHRNSQFLLDACETIMHLAFNPSNTTMLGDCGACEVLVEAFSTTFTELELGLEVCSGAMMNMATYGIAAKQNRFRLIDAGAVLALQCALSSKILSLRGRDNITQLLQILGAQDSSQRVRRGSRPPSNGNLVSIIHGSEMKGGTVPLQVEVRETIVREYPATPNSITSRSTESRAHSHRGGSGGDALVGAGAGTEDTTDAFGDYVRGNGSDEEEDIEIPVVNRYVDEFRDSSTHEI
mmetsp:Transcript_76519/g.150051  ORF Transcript_76519/g.150051 Transcript_76519/m.150051 type:complete len:491 (+) Transcript_76519:95-1567(+)